MTARKHNMRLKPRQIAPLAVLGSLLMAILGVALAALHPAWLVLAVPAALWALLCLVMGAVLAIKARRLPVLMAGPAAMAMHLGWALGFLSARQ